MKGIKRDPCGVIIALLAVSWLICTAVIVYAGCGTSGCSSSCVTCTDNCQTSYTDKTKCDTNKCWHYSAKVCCNECNKDSGSGSCNQNSSQPITIDEYEGGTPIYESTSSSTNVVRTTASGCSGSKNDTWNLNLMTSCTSG